MKILTGIAIIKDNVGDRITYTYSEIDTNGNLVKENIKESFVVVDPLIKDLVTDLENIINARLQATT